MKRVSVDTQIDRLEELIGRMERLIASQSGETKSLSAPQDERTTQALHSSNQEQIDKYIRDWHMNQGLDPDG